jgi:hypothetical protein
MKSHSWPHQERVVNEKKDLDAKISALNTFITSNPAYVGLSEGERSRLKRQWDAMKEYSDILGERIAAF